MSSLSNDQHRHTHAEWTKSPKFILRESAVADATASWSPGRFAEFGVGTGTMTRAFVYRGFHGYVYDVGEATRESLRLTVFPSSGPVSVVDSMDEIPDGSLDYLMAFEVLEHVTEDKELLSEWALKLRPGGRAVISVPAHQRKFSDTDRRVGHVRRYEKGAIERLLREGGFDEVRVINYGFPLGNLTGAIMSRLEKPQASRSEGQLERSVRSGVEQPTLVNKVSRVLNEKTLAPFLRLQRHFYDRDLGDGYVVTGRKTWAT